MDILSKRNILAAHGGNDAACGTVKRLGKSIRTLGALAALAVFSVVPMGCEHQRIDVGYFTASLSIETNPIRHGQTFVFQIHASTPSFKVIAFNFDLNDSKALVIDETYQVNSAGYKEFQFENVSISKSHRTRMEITVQDPTTGSKVDLTSEAIQELQDENVYLEFGPETTAPTGQLFAGSYNNVPAIIGGDNVMIKVHSSQKRLTLESFDWEFNDGTLKEGMTVDFDDNGEHTFIFRNVRVDEDSYTVPSKLKMTFRNTTDASTGSYKAEPLEYIKLQKFDVNVYSITKDVVDGGNFACRLTCNREKGDVTDIDSKIFKYDSSNPDKSVLPDGWYSNSYSLTFGDKHYVDITKTGIVSTFTADIEDVTTLYIVDTEYSGRKISISFNWILHKKTSASSVDFDMSMAQEKMRKGILTLDIDGYHQGGNVATFIVKPTAGGDYSDGQFVCSPVSGSGSGKVDVVLVANGDNTATCTLTSLKEGETTLRFSPKGKPSIYKDLKVMVRYRVGLQIDGAFENDVYQNDSQYYGYPRYYKLGENGQKYYVGWYSLPATITAQLVTWEGENDSELANLTAVSAKSINFYPLKNTGNIKTYSFSTRVQAQRRLFDFWPYGVAGLKLKNSPTLYPPKDDDDGFAHFMIYYTNSFYKNNSEYVPENNPTISRLNNYNVNENVSCEEACETLRKMDTYILVSPSSDFRSTNEWGYINLTVEDVNIDTDYFDFRYIFYMFKVYHSSENGVSGYWWEKVDKTPWCVKSGI